MTEKQKAVFDKIAELRDRLEDFRWELNVLRDAYDVLGCERDAVIERAEKAERALKFYGNPDNWRFSHDKENNLLWVTSLGPDYAMEILNGIVRESSEEKETVRVPGDGTLIIKKAQQ